MALGIGRLADSLRGGSTMWQLTSSERSRLLDAVRENAPHLLKVAEKVGRVPLTEEERESLRESLVDAIGRYGLRADGEVNEKGSRLDDVIGRLGMF
jgi:hypothetical protein